MHSRRQFAKTVLVGLPAAAFAARLDSKVAGVHLGTITYSFRDLPRMPGKDNIDDIIRAVTACGIGEIELYNLNLEPAPASAATWPTNWRPTGGICKSWRRKRLSGYPERARFSTLRAGDIGHRPGFAKVGEDGVQRHVVRLR